MLRSLFSRAIILLDSSRNCSYARFCRPWEHSLTFLRQDMQYASLARTEADQLCLYLDISISN